MRDGPEKSAVTRIQESRFSKAGQTLLCLAVSQMAMCQPGCAILCGITPIAVWFSISKNYGLLKNLVWGYLDDVRALRNLRGALCA